MLKKLDRVLGPAARILGSCLPKVQRKLHPLKLVIRPGGMGDLICADIALQEMSLRAQDFLWLIEKRSRPWAEFRGLPFLCYDEQPLHVLGQTWRRHSLVINTEQLFGLAQGCALLARSSSGRLACFETIRGARHAQIVVPYDWKDAHETREFTRLFAAALEMPEPAPCRLKRSRLEPANKPPLVVVAGCQSPSRAIGLQQWIRIVESWHSGRPFLIAASPTDVAIADQIAQGFPGIASRFEGDFPLLCQTIAHSEEILTMDGGPVHIASFYGAPTLAIFTSGRHRKWAPLAQGSRILRRHDLPCQPCTKFGQVPPCPIQYECRELRNFEIDGDNFDNFIST
jgi:heptosyltransferase-2